MIDRKKESVAVLSEVADVLSTVVGLSDKVENLWLATQCRLFEVISRERTLTKNHQQMKTTKSATGASLRRPVDTIRYSPIFFDMKANWKLGNG
jgi:hypothetical protein